MPSPEVARARELRRTMSGTERRVWYRLKGRRLAGYKFRRQLSVGPYFVDFVCLEARLAIEIDGAGHEDEEYDRRKTAYIESQGFRVLRIPASETDSNLDGVIDSIYHHLESGAPTLTLPSKWGGEMPSPPVN